MVSLQACNDVTARAMQSSQAGSDDSARAVQACKLADSYLARARKHNVAMIVTGILKLLTQPIMGSRDGIMAVSNIKVDPRPACCPHDVFSSFLFFYLDEKRYFRTIHIVLMNQLPVPYCTCMALYNIMCKKNDNIGSMGKHVASMGIHQIS